MASKEDEKHEKIIRGLLKLPANRKCINCGSLGPQYVCVNFSTFICTLCSGIHREFMHRIKSISMAKFTTTEIYELQSGGNDRAREVYLKEWNYGRNAYPDHRNPDKIREFIKLVYVQRRFTGEKVNDNNSHESRGFTKPEELNSPRNTATGFKRETVIRQLLQPPVEKRKGSIPIQRNGNTLKDLMVEKTPTDPTAETSPSIKTAVKSPVKSKLPPDPTAETSPSVKTAVKSPVKSVSLIDFEELPPEESKKSNTESFTRSSSMSLIDLISGPEETSNNNVDPFTTPVGLSKLTETNRAVPSTETNLVSLMDTNSVVNPLTELNSLTETVNWQSQQLAPPQSTPFPMEMGMGNMNLYAPAPFATNGQQYGNSFHGQAQSANPFDLAPLSNSLYTTGMNSYYNGGVPPTWSDTMMVRQHAPYIPETQTFNFHQAAAPMQMMHSYVQQAPVVHNMNSNYGSMYETVPVAGGGNPFA